MHVRQRQVRRQLSSSFQAGQPGRRSRLAAGMVICRRLSISFTGAGKPRRLDLVSQVRDSKLTG
jgi:hypothetical protein